ncbi:MAG: rRNA maturation RNase YbeY [Acidimicrobiales bacterium]|nr:rRNA maturation RNase YbeY [Acidimicrobiales bacterium]
MTPPQPPPEPPDPTDPFAEPVRGPSLHRQRRIGPEGEVTVFAADEQAAVPVDAGRWAALAEQVLVAEGVRGEAELSLLFVDEEAMADLNGRFLHARGPTDVLAFPIDADDADVWQGSDPTLTGPDRDPPDPSDAPMLLGDVVVCPAVAARNAPEHAGTLDDELALLVVHGVLHVLGHDHAEPAARAAMWARERELIERFHGRPGRDPWQA